jgi:hypothetical protein
VIKPFAIQKCQNDKKMKKTDENIENQLGGIKKGQPFRVPENYFETFADRLMIRIVEEEGGTTT